MHVEIREFDDLTPRQLHEILRLRAQVFAVEQNCVYCDPDDADLVARHVLLREDGRLVAYARVQPDPRGPRIGRVVTSADVRGRGLGHAVVSRCLAEIGPHAACLSAQDHLRAFYAQHGFRPVGDVFLEDGIPHVWMERAAR